MYIENRFNDKVFISDKHTQWGKYQKIGLFTLILFLQWPTTNMSINTQSKVSMYCSIHRYVCVTYTISKHIHFNTHHLHKYLPYKLQSKLAKISFQNTPGCSIYETITSIPSTPNNFPESYRTIQESIYIHSHFHFSTQIYGEKKKFLFI